MEFAEKLPTLADDVGFRWTAEKAMLEQMVKCAVVDARGESADFHQAKTEERRIAVRREAQDWFVSDSSEGFGWRFVADTLRLSHKTRRRIEDEAFGKGSVIEHPRPARPAVRMPGRPRKPTAVAAERPKRGRVTDEEWRQLRAVLSIRGRRGPVAKHSRRAILNEVLVRQHKRAGFAFKPNFKIKHSLTSYYLKRWETSGQWATVSRVLGLNTETA